MRSCAVGQTGLRLTLRMKTRAIHIAIIAGLYCGLILHSGKTVADTDPVPVAPINAVEYGGWPNAFVLRNEHILVVIVPEIGRITHLGFLNKDNVLRHDEDLIGQQGETDISEDWLNHGGDWIWPVAQSRWPDFQEGHWPPSPLLEGQPWSGRAWRTEDGSLHCLITRDFGEPLQVRVSRTFRLAPSHTHVTVRQRIKRLESSDVPVTLWHLSQIQDAEQVVLPVDADSRFEGGITTILLDMPDDTVLERCEDTVVYDAQQDGEHKLGSDSARSWIAARKGYTLLVARVDPEDHNATCPDSGCTLQMYAHTGLRYAELGMLSGERYLEPEEHVSNTLTLSLHLLEDIPETPCALARTVQELLGERMRPEPDLPGL